MTSCFGCLLKPAEIGPERGGNAELGTGSAAVVVVRIQRIIMWMTGN